jgi:hypothetical protein
LIEQITIKNGVVQETNFHPEIGGIAHRGSGWGTALILIGDQAGSHPWWLNEPNHPIDRKGSGQPGAEGAPIAADPLVPGSESRLAAFSPGARAADAGSVSNSRLRRRGRSVISCYRVNRSQKREGRLCGDPLLADLILHRQAAGSGGAVFRVFLISRLWFVDVLDEVVDRGFLSRTCRPLRALWCFCHFDPPERFSTRSSTTRFSSHPRF